MSIKSVCSCEDIAELLEAYQKNGNAGVTDWLYNSNNPCANLLMESGSSFHRTDRERTHGELIKKIKLCKKQGEKNE